MKKILISLVLLTLLVLPSINAFMLPDHQLINDEVFGTYQGTSDFYETCLKYPELCTIGDFLTDLSVIYYYVNGGVKYQVTHSPGFCVNMLQNAKGRPELGITLEEEQACAIGSCLHASQDYVSHTIMVPYAIHHTLLPNQVIHVFAEQKFTNINQNEHPEVKTEIESLTPEDWQKCIPIVKETLEGYSDYKDEVESGKTDDLINAFIFEVYNSVNPESATSYDLAFKDKVSIFGKINLIPVGFLLGYVAFMLLFGTIAILTIFKKGKGFLNYLVIVIFGFFTVIMVILFISMLNGNLFQTVVFLVKPISNLVPIGNSQSYIDMSVQNGYGLFNDGESFIASIDNPKVASGFEVLAQANQDIKVADYFIVGTIILLLLFLLYKNFKPKKSKEIF